MSTTTITPVLAVHGGAGTISRGSVSPERDREYREALTGIVAAGQAVLAGGGSAVDAVTEAVRLLEECPLFNAGRGAVLTSAGTHELDAAVMDGRTLAAGAVAGVRRVRNPVLAARMVMDSSQHVLFAGEGAETFAREHGAEMVDPGFFETPQRRAQLARVQRESPGSAVLDHDAERLTGETGTSGDAGAPPVEPLDPDRKHGTVGAVALDAEGRLAAATSTGGITNKQVGRVGDTPLIGAGTYADTTCAVSATGTGEMFIRTVAAYDIAAQMAYAGRSLEEAAARVVHDRLPAIGGSGGLIAVDARGRVTLPCNTAGMYRGHGRAGEDPIVAIYADEPV